MSERVRVGIIGTSEWADFMYLSSLHEYPQADLVAICGRNQEHAQEMAAKYNIAQVFTDYKAMIDQAGLDMIVIGAPDDLHHEIAMQAFEAGLHVLCDKPLAFSLQQARDMLDAAQKSHQKHMVLFTYRYYPFFRYVHDLLTDGLIGRCYHCEFRYLMGYARQPQYFWRIDQERANGALGDLGVHMIDMARWLVGDVKRVSAQSGVFVVRNGVDGEPLNPANDSSSLLVEFENGSQGFIHASLVAHLGDRFMQQQVKLYGEGGSLEIDIQYRADEAQVDLFVARDPGEQFEQLQVPASYWGDVDRSDTFAVFRQQSFGCRAFVDAILEDRQITPDFLDGYKAQQVIEAASQSGATGQRVNIKDLP